MHSLGTQSSRVVIRELGDVLALGFPISGGNTIADFAPNMLVKLNSDGTVSPISASTDKVLGRVASTYQHTDKGVVRVVTPFESHVVCKANGTLDEGNLVACTGFDSTAMMPIFKAGASGDYISGICIKGGSTGATDCEVGILYTPMQLAIPTPP